MPLLDARPTPQLNVEMLESILTMPALLEQEKSYVFNRVVGEYAAYAVLSHLEQVDAHEESLLNGDAPKSWREIDDETRYRYRDMLSVLRDTKARRYDLETDLEWDWLTLRAMQSLREAARSSDDELNDVIGPQVERSKLNDEVWRTYLERVEQDGRTNAGPRPLTTSDVDRFITATSSQIRHQYLAKTDPSTPYLNEYADAACRGEQDRAYRQLVDIGRTIDSTYEPTFTAKHDAQMAVVATHVRPTQYDIIAALENGNFEDLVDLTVMPEEEFDELMSDAMDVYMNDHAGDENLLEETTTLMDDAERLMGRPVVWRESETRDLLREEQNLRDQQIATTDGSIEAPAVVETDANGLPSLSTVEAPEPSLFKEAVAGYEHAQEEAQLRELEASGVLDDEAADEIAQELTSTQRVAGETALRRAEEEAAEQERRAARQEQELRDSVRLIQENDGPAF